MNSAICIGTIAHKRHIPKRHRFSYPIFMWYLDLDELDRIPNLGRWFSVDKWALSRFHRPDYLGDPKKPLAATIRQRMAELTGIAATGKIYGLMNTRTLGLYFSPVNFYYAFNTEGELSHFLAEVSNTPWNERHQYAHYVADNQLTPTHAKAFHVSPFNPINQTYSWSIGVPGDTIGVHLSIEDHRGHIFEAHLNLTRHPLTLKSVKKELTKKPVMTAFILAGIYWQAFKLFIKGIPYVSYRKEMI